MDIFVDGEDSPGKAAPATSLFGFAGKRGLKFYYFFFFL